ncbi:DNA polymerase III subunit psi [Motilimonas pumila]|nr:DNA polymerase III subunit psi [Motilimonas pumila]
MQKSRTLILILAVFILPIAVAKLLLSQQWYQSGSLNKGEFLQTEVALQLPDNQHWVLLYQEHASHPQQVSRLMTQLIRSLGREQVKVAAIEAKQFPLLERSFTDASNYCYIVNPQGQVLLRYPLPQSTTEQAKMAKAMQYDLRKLIKMSGVS